MTYSEQELIFMDLSSRLPYGVHVNISNKDDKKGKDCLVTSLNKRHVNGTYSFNENSIKPYLRPLSKMTHQECIALSMLLPRYISIEKGEITVDSYKILPEHIRIINDFYNRHHLDFRDLIKDGLALEATSQYYIP